MVAGVRPRLAGGEARLCPNVKGGAAGPAATEELPRPNTTEPQHDVGHTLVLGTTRVGKTRLAELLINQDIRRGDVVIVFDPKTDKMVVQRKELTEFLQRWDKDGNGVLSKAEFSRMFQLKDKPKGKKYSAFSSTNYREYDRHKMEKEEARQLQRERFALRQYGKDHVLD